MAVFKVILVIGILLFIATVIFQMPYLAVSEFNVTTLNILAFEVLKVPLSILAATITIMAIISALHRSAQISMQIKLSSEQNNFSNYYKHMEEFEKYISGNKLFSNYYEIHSVKSLHNKIWPNFRDGDYSVSSYYLKYTKFLFEKMTTELYEIPDKEDEKKSTLSEIKQSRTDLESCYFLRQAEPSNNDRMLYHHHVLPCINLASDICQILDFEYNVDEDESFSKIKELSKTTPIASYSNINLDAHSWEQNPQESIINTLKIAVIGTISFAYDPEQKST